VKIKLDENLPARLATALSQLGHQVDTVPSEGLAGQEDATIWKTAQAAGCFFITQDLDFSDLRDFRPGNHPGILLLRLIQPGRNAIFERLFWLFRNETVEDWVGCFVIASDTKIRIRRPEEPRS
jgi:predicted nuclease of predicted toxin-antitoxin system